MHEGCFQGDPLKHNRLDKWVRQMPSLCDEIAKLLISSGANPNIINAQGMTPLALAAGKGNRLMVKYLLCHNAQPWEGINPIKEAAKSHKRYILSQFIFAAGYTSYAKRF